MPFRYPRTASPVLLTSALLCTRRYQPPRSPVLTYNSGVPQERKVAQSRVSQTPFKSRWGIALGRGYVGSSAGVGQTGYLAGSKIDDVRIWRSVRSAQDLASSRALHARSEGCVSVENATGLVACWDFSRRSDENKVGGFGVEAVMVVEEYPVPVCKSIDDSGSVVGLDIFEQAVVSGPSWGFCSGYADH
eukprot:2721974-Rhodomonas_salina.2